MGPDRGFKAGHQCSLSRVRCDLGHYLSELRAWAHGRFHPAHLWGTHGRASCSRTNSQNPGKDEKDAADETLIFLRLLDLRHLCAIEMHVGTTCWAQTERGNVTAWQMGTCCNFHWRENQPDYGVHFLRSEDLSPEPSASPEIDRNR